MYQIYQSKAFVIKSVTQKEQDQRVLVFSREFGLVWLNAMSSKRDGSKMRNFLQDFTFADIYIVFGKGGLRLTGGEYLDNFFFSFKYNKEYKIFIMQKIFDLLLKNLVLEHAEKKVFDLLEKFIFEILEEKEKSKIEEKEVVFLAKFLFEFGYFEEKYFVKKDKLSKEDLKKMKIKVNEIFGKM